MPQTSRAWPYIRAIGRSLTIPGTNIGLKFLTDIQDQLSNDENKAAVREALDALLTDTKTIRQQLEADQVAVDASRLAQAGTEIAETLYLDQLARSYLYVDFKGIEQLEKLIPLKLDDVFVNLKVRTEDAAARRVAPDFTSAGILAIEASARSMREHFVAPHHGVWDPRGDRIEELLRRRLVDIEDSAGEVDEALLADVDAENLRQLKFSSQPQPIDRILTQPGGVVLLGGPGSGKTTLVKRLARTCALGPQTAKERYPAMPWCLPVALPVTACGDAESTCPLFELIQDRLRATGGEALVRVFLDHWAAGQCLVLLDGLDEVADAGRRIACSRAVGELLRTLGGNRALISSRPIGYTLCRVGEARTHVYLQPFERADIETFARQWYAAYDQASRPEAPDPARAATAAQELIAEIQANPRVESLAANPLMVTIIALIKQQNVRLPERRVGLYEIALNSLIRSWNLARSLSGKPVGRDLSLEETRKVWAEVAFWMHAEKSTGTCHHDQLMEHLVAVLKKDGFGDLEATRTAESYIDTATERAGLLEERGANVFAFMHQTFQEYLAARHLAKPHSQVIKRVLPLVPDPRWHEVVRLTAGYIGVIQDDPDMVTDLVSAIASNEADPLEPYLFTGLRLAVSCIADNVRVRPAAVDDALIRICRILTGANSIDLVPSALLNALPALSFHVPGTGAVARLIALAEHSQWPMRREAARALIRAAPTSDDAHSRLRQLFADDHVFESHAYAAWGLWRSGDRQTGIAESIVFGLASPEAGLKLPVDGELTRAIMDLLEVPDAHVRLRAVDVLGERGYKAEALPALLKLLEDQDAQVRCCAAEVLGQWGHQAEALPVLLKLLEDPDAGLRLRAADILGEWGHQAQALPSLLKMLEDGDANVRYRAARVLGRCGHQAGALPGLLKLLEDHDADVRYRAAEVLGQWGHQAQALPAMLKLLEHEDAKTRFDAARLLGEWGHQTEALPVLLKLLGGQDADMRFRVAAVLGQWGHQAEALPALLKLLEEQETHLRYRAADVLKQSGATAPASRQVLTRLLGTKVDAALAYFDQAARRPCPPEPAAAELLIRAIKPQPKDDDRTALLRQVVFAWLWRATGAG